MATRATIIVEGQPSVKVYKHWDGNEGATLPWLEEFNMAFTYARGDDPEYKLAQLLRSSAFDAEKYNLDPSRDTGWGIVPINADVWEEYEYHLHADGNVTVKTGKDIKREEHEEQPCDYAANFIRAMSTWLDQRPEIANDGKTIEQLIKEFKIAQA